MSNDETKPSKVIKELKEFANVHDLVEFGAIKESDEIDPVGGVTFNPERKDSFYAHGSVGGRETSLLLREFKLVQTAASDERKYLWVALKLVLTPAGNLPHIFVDSHQADNDFYRHLIDVLGHFENVDEQIKLNDQNATERFHFFSRLQDAHLMSEYFSVETLAFMNQQLSGFSFEALDRQLILYRDGGSINQAVLKEMLENALKLAEILERPI